MGALFATLWLHIVDDGFVCMGSWDGEDGEVQRSSGLVNHMCAWQDETIGAAPPQFVHVLIPWRCINLTHFMHLRLKIAAKGTYSRLVRSTFRYGARLLVFVNGCVVGHFLSQQ